MNESIFHAYDVRAKSPEELNEKDAYIIGRAFGVFMLERKFDSSKTNAVVGSDSRETSPILKDAIIKGLNEEGISVIDGGLMTTPMHNYSVVKSDSDGGIMVTASHNPKEYNGFKFALRGAKEVGDGTGLEQVKKIALRGVFKSAENKGSVSKTSFENDYIKFLLDKNKIENIKSLNIVIDAGNGMTGLFLPKLLDKTNVKYTPMYFDVDMSFPNHEADPIKEETLKDLKKEVINKGADFGVAFDGDGDRLGIVNDRGKFITSDRIGAFLASFILKKKGKGNIIYDVRSTRLLPESIVSAGGNPIICRVGRTYIKNKMRDKDALFAAELSGHFYFKDFFYGDSAFMAFLLFIEAVSEGGKKVSDLLRPYEAYYSSGEINFEVKSRDSILENISSHFKGGSTQWIDGVTVSYKDWWFNARLSNTEPLIRINIEADNKELLKEKAAYLKSLIVNI